MLLHIFITAATLLTFPTPCVKYLHAFMPLSYSIYKFQKYECFASTIVQNVSTLVQIHIINWVNIFVLVSYSNYKDRYMEMLGGHTGRDPCKAALSITICP